MSLIPKPKIEKQEKNTNKLELDKYYTPLELAERLIKKTFDILGTANISEIIE